ncbi:hypothetical protein [Streptomyces sp. NPDC006477]|uniref:hypothetical protein n=1 Tax=Streptomyces sp. NPDC006477 TaxID=3364747 RepID=UPI003677BE28
MLKNSSKTTRTAVWVAAALSLVTGGVYAGVAGASAAPAAKAAAPGARAAAPYAQAAAVVNADGSINRSKGISSVTKPAVGKYCVELEDKDLDLTKLVPVATLQYTSFEYGIRISYWPHPDCGGRADTIHVITGMPNRWVDQAFGIVVP